MSGHSKWSTIKRQKGANDAKRGQTFTKLGNSITLAAKLGNSGDVDSNPRLRLAVELARAVNMPKENIQRAIDKGLGKLPGQTIEEVLYEGFGPGKVAFLVEGITDNKMRTTSEIRNMFDKNGGNMGNTGSTAHMFQKVGEVKVKGKGGSIDDEELELMDTGADDMEDYEEDGVQKYLLITQPNSVHDVSTKVTQLGFEVESADVSQHPTVTVEINNKETADKVLAFTEKIEDHDDIQKVYANFLIPDDLV